MKTHLGNVDSPRDACAAFAHLAINNDNKVAIAAAGGIPVRNAA